MLWEQWQGEGPSDNVSGRLWEELGVVLAKASLVTQSHTLVLNLNGRSPLYCAWISMLVFVHSAVEKRIQVEEMVVSET